MASKESMPRPGFVTRSVHALRAAEIYALETVRSYARPLLAVSALFLAGAGVSFAFGREYRAHMAAEQARAPRPVTVELDERFLAEIRQKWPDFFGGEEHVPTWRERAAAGVSAGAGVFLPLAFGAALLTLCAIVTGCAFGVVPMLVGAAAGVLPGVVLRLALDDFGAQGILSAFLVFSPTILLTIPAVLLGAAIGLRLGAAVRQKCMGAWWQQQIRRGLSAWLRLVLPAIALGAGLQISVIALLWCMRPP